MRKIVFCNIPMKEELTPLSYQKGNLSLDVDAAPVAYPIMSVLSGYLQPEDSVKLVLLCRCDPQERYLRNVEHFREEFRQRCGALKDQASCVVVNTEFAEGESAASRLLMELADICEPGAKLAADITYGPKSLPVVLLAALAFAMRHQHCELDYLLYGQVYFQEGVPTEPRLCDLSYLLYLNSLIYTLQCDSPEKAKRSLEMMLSL